MKKKLEVSVYDDYIERPSHAIVALNQETISRIKKLAKVCKELEVASINLFDYTPDLIDDEGKEWTEWYPETVQLIVYADSFHWSGYVKHTSINWETERIQLKEI